MVLLLATSVFFARILARSILLLQLVYMKDTKKTTSLNSDRWAVGRHFLGGGGASRLQYHLFLWYHRFLGPYCWWFRNPANQLRLVVYPTIYRGFSTIPGGWPWDFWTINSIKQCNDPFRWSLHAKVHRRRDQAWTIHLSRAVFSKLLRRNRNVEEIMCMASLDSFLQNGERI